MILYRIELIVGTVRHIGTVPVCVESGGVIAFTMAHNDDAARGEGRVQSEVARGVVTSHTPSNPYSALWNQTERVAHTCTKHGHRLPFVYLPPTPLLRSL